MKNWILPGALMVALGVLIWKLDAVTDITADMVDSRPKVVIDTPNAYANDDDFIYVQKSKDFVPYSRQDILNIFYSIFDNGYETFTFYCPSEYASCLNDIEEITSNQTMITDIGNYVNPFNNFTNIKVITDSLGEVNVVITKTYSQSMRDAIDKELDRIFAELFVEEMDINDKILKIHDYIIDKAYYDMEDHENSGNAYGALIEGRAKCAGYADAMALALSRLGVVNYKVASEKHVWNAVYLDGKWEHIDLTWDDPVVQEGATLTDTIRHKFYRIDTDTLLSYDTLEHNFDMNVYIELR